MDSMRREKRVKKMNTIKRMKRPKAQYAEAIYEEVIRRNSDMVYRRIPSSKPVPMQMIFFRRFFCGICRMSQCFRVKSMRKHGFCG